MKKRSFSIVLVLLMFGMLFPSTTYSQELDPLVIEIRVAPNVLNIQNQGEVVTIHTNLSFWSVDFQSVYLNGIFVQSVKADDRGYFVAKFNMDAVQALEDLNYGEYNTLTLVGEKLDGTQFIGTKEIMVINVEPVKTGKI